MVEGEEGERLASEPSKKLCSELVQWSAEAVLAGDLQLVCVTGVVWSSVLHSQQKAWCFSFPPNGSRAVIAVGSLGNHTEA